MRIEEFVDPVIDKTWGELGAQIKLSDKKVEVGLGYPADGFAEELSAELARFLGVEDLDVDFRFMRPKQRSFADVSRVIAVASGKGGVGKSTCAVNLAMALEQQGARVGLLDADIYGPNQHILFDVLNRKPEVQTVDGSKSFIPIRVNNIALNSMGFVLDNDKAAMWRGPMLSGAIKQLKNLTQWGDLDYLFIDMPPGTGDTQLTFAQEIKVDGIIIVSTPQEIALLDVKRGINMFDKLKVPILGLVDNMSFFETDEGKKYSIFGEDGVEKVAKDYKKEFLGKIPISIDLRVAADSGKPLVEMNPDHKISKIFKEMATKVKGSFL